MDLGSEGLDLGESVLGPFYNEESGPLVSGAGEVSHLSLFNGSTFKGSTFKDSSSYGDYLQPDKRTEPEGPTKKLC